MSRKVHPTASPKKEKNLFFSFGGRRVKFSFIIKSRKNYNRYHPKSHLSQLSQDLNYKDL